MADLKTTISDIVDASKVPAKKRGTNVKPTVETLASLAYESGVLPDDLGQLIDLVTHQSCLDQASLGAIIRNLYPTYKVPAEHVLKIVGCLGHGQHKPSLPVQSLLLKWLITVYHILETPAVLSQSYPVLFSLLDTSFLRPQTCHLLALITRRKHVRPYRIQAVLNLSRLTGKDPVLTGLLRVYKNYYPEIVVGEAIRGRAVAFKHPDPQWRMRLDEIQEARRQSVEQAADAIQDGFRTNQQALLRSRGQKVTVPSVATSHVQERAVTLEELENAQGLAQNLEKIELPNQLVAVLADPLLQKLFLLRPAIESDLRVRNWLLACIADAADGDTDDGALLDLLEIVHDFVVRLKTMPPLFELLFFEIFKTWDGRDRRDVLTETLSYAPFSRFDDLYTALFQPMERCILDDSADSQLHLLRFYTMLLRRWTAAMLSSDFESALGRFAITALIEHVNRLCLTLVQTSPSATTQLTILEFYEQVVALISQEDLLEKTQITLPPSELVYTLHFGESAAVLSRLCRVLAEYKRALEANMNPRSRRQLTVHEREHVRTFNGFLMDICNCLWRGKAFNRSDTDALGCRVPEPVVSSLASYLMGLDSELALASLFALSHSPTLALQSIMYLRELEDAEEDDITVRHGGPVTQNSLARLGAHGGLQLDWQEYRSGVLGYLEENGLGGIPDLMYHSMKNLKNLRAPQPSSQAS